jgi:hypothetical protein
MQNNQERSAIQRLRRVLSRLFQPKQKKRTRWILLGRVVWHVTEDQFQTLVSSNTGDPVILKGLVKSVMNSSDAIPVVVIEARLSPERFDPLWRQIEQEGGLNSFRKSLVNTTLLPYGHLDRRNL